MSLIFTCPKCSGHRLEEVMTGCLQYTEVTVIDESGALDYGDHNCDGGEVVTYQCLNCGFDLAVSNEEDLVEWLRKHSEE